MNSIILLGRTTDTVELKQTQNGKSVASFSLAVRRPYTKNVTDFYTVVCWGSQAEHVSRYVKKGNQICIRGYLTTRSWTDAQGQKRYATEVVADEVTFVGSHEGAEGAQGAGGAYLPGTTDYIPNTYQNAAQSVKFEEIADNDGLPF